MKIPRMMHMLFSAFLPGNDYDGSLFCSVLFLLILLIGFLVYCFVGLLVYWLIYIP